MPRLTMPLLVLCCLVTSSAYAIFGFGDEEKLPGTWNGPLGAYAVFRKDGTVTFHEVLGFTHECHWSCGGGNLTTWYDDAGIIDQFRGVQVIKKATYPIKFNGSDEMTFGGANYTRDKSK